MVLTGLLLPGGALNAIYFLPLLLLNKNRRYTDNVAQGKYLPSIKELLNMTLTFGLTVIAWVFFRAENIGHAWSYLSVIFSPTLFHQPYYVGIGLTMPIIILMLLFLFIEWIGREDDFAIAKLTLKWKRPVRWLFYYILIAVIIKWGGVQQEFIYFQF